MDDYDGQQVIDAGGEHIGTVERSYVDDNQVIRFVEIKMGGLLAKHRLVPVDQAEMTGDGLRVPYIKDMIEESPHVSRSDTLEGGTLEEVRAYYQHGDGLASRDAVQGPGERDDLGARTPEESASARDETTDVTAIPRAGGENNETGSVGSTGATDGTPSASAGMDTTPAITVEGGGIELQPGVQTGEIRDLGDVIEVPIMEEVLVKQTVVKEVLRIKKTELTETQTVAGDVRREDVEVVPTEGVNVSGDVDPRGR